MSGAKDFSKLKDYNWPLDSAEVSKKSQQNCFEKVVLPLTVLTIEAIIVYVYCQTEEQSHLNFMTKS